MLLNRYDRFFFQFQVQKWWVFFLLNYLVLHKSVENKTSASRIWLILQGPHLQRKRCHTVLHANLKKKNLPVFFSSKWIAWDLHCASCPITQTTRTHEQSTWIFYFEKDKATCRHFCWASCWSRGWGEAKFPLFAALTYAVQHFLSICLFYIKPSSSTQKYMS